MLTFGVDRHGHRFWVMGQGGFGAPFNESTFNLVDPMYRDTQAVPYPVVFGLNLLLYFFHPY